MTTPRIQLTDAPTHEDLAQLGGALAQFNDADVGPSQKRNLAVLVRGDDNQLLGGLNGYTAWGWLYVQWLWIAEELRGQGMAGKLLAEAEAEAVARGCHGSLIDSFSPTAIAVYQRAGYAEFGRLPDFPHGRSRVYLQKAL